jgi:protein-disulfide isomerase/peroxiredoxin
MSVTLVPGVEAPDFPLFDGYQGKTRILVFFPASFVLQNSKKLEQYFEKNSVFTEKDAVSFYISDLGQKEWESLIKTFEAKVGIFYEEDDEKSIAKSYRSIASNQDIEPSVFIIDPVGVIRRIYAAEKYPDLPNPALIGRFLAKFNQLPTPLPIDELDWIYGNQQAKITMIKYGDYQCKPCAQATGVLQEVMKKYNDNVRFVFRHLPLRHTHPLAQEAAESAEAAGNQGKFWEMHYLLYQQNAEVDRDRLLSLAKGLKLDMEKFTTELNNRTHKDSVNSDFKSAVKNKIKLPATLFINGELFEGPKNLETISKRIEALIDCYKT